MAITPEELHGALDWVISEMPTQSFAREEALDVLVLTYHALTDSDCAACDVNTIDIGEYYMVTDELWKRYGCGVGYLCLGCLEDRMSRSLMPEDFIDCALNTDTKRRRSARYNDRLGISLA